MREQRVFGPPGTGKTTHLKRRVAATVKERGPRSIAIASLTKAAAAEIAGRVDLPFEQVGTLHAHAYRALERPDLADTPEGKREWNDYAERRFGPAYNLTISRAIDPELDDAGGAALALDFGSADALLQAYGTYRARCLPAELMPTEVRTFAEYWEAFKKARKRIDFADVIDEATREFPTMPGGPQVFLLDEAQDMSRHEMQLARQWGESCDVFVAVGDPYQNLYQWRGSEPEAFDDGGIDDDQITVLDQSWRVPHAVHDYAVRFVNDNLPGGLRISYKPRDADGAVRRGDYTFKSPEELVNNLERDLSNGLRSMVLGATGYMLDPIIAVLKQRGVPFGNPYKVQHGGWNPLYGVQRLLAFLRPQGAVWGSEARPWYWSDLLKWAEPLDARAVFERGAKAFIESKCMPGELLPDEDAEPGDVPADINTVFNLLKPEHRDEVFDCSLDWYERHLRKTRAGQLAYGLNAARKHGGKALRTAPLSVSHGSPGWPGIILGSIHSVKGGEADKVYVFPDVSNAGFDGWLMPGWRHDAIVRQFYVAFTRARSELVLCERSSALAVNFDR